MFFLLARRKELGWTDPMIDPIVHRYSLPTVFWFHPELVGRASIPIRSIFSIYKKKYNFFQIIKEEMKKLVFCFVLRRESIDDG